MKQLKKLLKRSDQGQGNKEPASQLLAKKPEPTSPVNRIVVRKGNAINIIPVDQIRYVEAQDDYVMILSFSREST